MININEVFSIYNQEQVDQFLEKQTGFSLNEKNLVYDKIKKHWNFIGDNASNGSVINILREPEKGLIERITNGIDAVMEKQKNLNFIAKAQTSNDIIEKAFPRYYQSKKNVETGNLRRLNACEAADKITVIIHDGSKSNKPTIEVIDEGTGIDSEKFKNTILSINQGNKLSNEKKYLIGAFGQGGSTSLPFSYATLIISKTTKNQYSFTIVKRVELDEYKNYCYVYLKDKESNSIFTCNNLNLENDNTLKEFIESESGTLVRMIDMEIDSEYRVNDVSKPGMLGDYINTELFNVPLPIKIIENRKKYEHNKHIQNRNSYGSYYKLQTWEYCRKELSGTIEITHNERPYKINYYFILPTNEDDWYSDSECKKIFKQFNTHLDPIMFTVNGQLITTERFTKLKNVGLSFLQYRLLIEINLDNLGIEKYRFFTADRSRIQNSDLTKGFIEKVIIRLRDEEKIIEMNELIANKSISNAVDKSMIDEISNNVKSLYTNYLKNKNTKVLSGVEGRAYRGIEEEEFSDEIEIFKITTAKNEYFKNEKINIVLTTNAKKSVNRSSRIDMFLDNKAYYDSVPSYMNGRIQYTIPLVSPGKHKVFFELYENDKLINSSNEFEFNMLNELQYNGSNKIVNNKELNLKIHTIEDREVIFDIARNENENCIEIFICLNHESLISVYDEFNSADEVHVLKRSIIQPLCLFGLFLENKYDEIEKNEEKNKIIMSLIKTLVITQRKFLVSNDVLV